MNKDGEEYVIRYNDDHALVTISLRLEYGQALLEDAETQPTQPDSQEYLQLRAALEKFVSRTHGLDMSDAGQWIKPRHYEVAYDGRQQTKQHAA